MNKARALFLIATLTLTIATLTLVAGPAAPTQGNTGTIRGIITRAGSTDALPEVQVTVFGRSGTPSAAAVQALMFDATLAGINLTANEINEDTLNVLQAQIDAAAIGGIARSKEFQATLNALRPAGGQFSAQSDNDGRFSIPNVPPGTYTFRAEREGYFGSTLKGSTPLAVTTNITVTAGQTTEVSASLLPGGTISGTVRDDTGQPRSKGNVQAFSVAYRDGFPVLAPTVAKVTNDLGEYRLFWLPPGAYYIGATAEPPRAGAGEATTAPPAIVTYYPGTLDVQTGTLLEIKGGEQIEGMNISLRSSKLAKISGQVVAKVPAEALTSAQRDIGGNPAAVPAVLQLLIRNPNTPDNIGARVVGTAFLNPTNGRFDVPNILPGSYDLYGRTEDFTNGTPFLGRAYDWGHTEITVTDRDVEGILITLNPGVSVKGTVLVDGAAPQNPVRVAVEPDGTAVKLGAYRMISQRPATTGPDGSFVITGIPSGRFRLNTQGLPPQFYIADIRQGASVFDSGFEIKGGEESSPLTVEIRSGAGTITGTVQGERLEPVPGALVVAVPSVVNRRTNRMLYRTATSDAAGRFSIPGIAPGDYKLFAWDAIAGGAYFNSGFISKYEERGKTVHVSQTTATTIDLPVLSGAPGGR